MLEGFVALGRNAEHFGYHHDRERVGQIGHQFKLALALYRVEQPRTDFADASFHLPDSLGCKVA